jgi:iron(III) transport system substrate-binding protein
MEKMLRLSLLGCVAPLLAGGCWRAAESEVVVYCALDAEFARPIFADFTRESGIQVAAKFDTESTKTVGLAEALLAERGRPRCDVFWNNETLHTLRLEKQGLLEPFAPPAAADFPPAFRAADGAWHGFAARARVLVVNTRLLPTSAERPRSIRDLADPRWRGRAAIAKPLFGSTATHAACLFAAWGAADAEEFFRAVKQNEVQILSGNKQVAMSVAGGQLAFGLTDTDDAIIEREKGLPVEIVYPDQGDGELGTLFIPNAVAVVRGGPHPAEARRLVEYLLSPAVEAKLAAGPSAQIPLNPKTDAAVRVATPRTVKAMAVDWPAAAAAWEPAAQFLRATFAGS